eukprot:365281-Chlamydomonas_euryale.AAC.2
MPRPPASGIYAYACPWFRASRDVRPQHMFCARNTPISVSHKGNRSGPLMHILRACMGGIHA